MLKLNINKLAERMGFEPMKGLLLYTLVTHLYGMPNNMDHICRIAKKNKLFIIEDIAQSHLAEYKKKIVGNFGDISCMSFYPSKNLGALGDGGAIITNSKTNYLRCKSYANYGAINFRNPNHNQVNHHRI